jgi:hypothetical protein
VNSLSAFVVVRSHHITNCKAKVVFLAEESESESNKNNLSYFEVYEREEVVGRLSKIRSVL